MVGEGGGGGGEGRGAQTRGSNVWVIKEGICNSDD